MIRMANVTKKARARKKGRRRKVSLYLLTLGLLSVALAMLRDSGTDITVTKILSILLREVITSIIGAGHYE